MVPQLFEGVGPMWHHDHEEASNEYHGTRSYHLWYPPCHSSSYNRPQ